MDVIKKSLEIQKTVEDKTKHLGKGRYGRVLRMAKKPDSEEYTKIIQITGIGIAIIGGLGFLVYWIWNFAPEHLRSLLGL